MSIHCNCECGLKLEELYSGHSVVAPRNEDHARYMIQIASFYLEQHHQETLKALTKDYSNER